MPSRRRLDHYTEEELEELLHAPATSGLRNVLSFGRKRNDATPEDILRCDPAPPPDDVLKPGDVLSSGPTPDARSGLQRVTTSDFPTLPFSHTGTPDIPSVLLPSDNSSPGDELSLGRRTAGMSGAPV